MDVLNFIKEALPELSEEIVSETWAVLDSLGVTASTDLCLVRESDLMPPLKAIQARKLVARWAGNTAYKYQINFTSGSYTYSVLF